VSSQETTHLGRVVPVYQESKGLTSRYFRYVLKPILKNLAEKIPETLPEEIRKEYNLLELKEALYQIHFPDSMKMAQKARERFSFENIFFISLFSCKKRVENQKEKTPRIPINQQIIDRFIASLPFELTKSQKEPAKKS